MPATQQLFSSIWLQSCLRCRAAYLGLFFIVLLRLQELGDKFVWTVRLHAGLAACQMRMARWEDAEGELLQVADSLWLLELKLLHGRCWELHACPMRMGRWGDAKVSCGSQDVKSCARSAR